jgi:hypothetical protein
MHKQWSACINQLIDMKQTCFAIFTLIQLVFSPRSFCQNDSAVLLKEVIVSGVRVSKINETPLNVTSLSVQKVRTTGSLNISDALSKLPGLSQLNTGP